MITFGFKNKYSGIFRAVTALIIGFTMIVLPGESINLVVKILGTLLIASGIVSIIVGLANNKSENQSVVAFNAIVNIIIGLLIFLNPAFVASIVIVLLGIGLLIFGGVQLLALFSARELIKMSSWGYALPFITTIGGLLLVFKPFGTAEFISFIAGGFLITYSISEFLSVWKMNKAIKEYDIKISGTPSEANSEENKLKYEDIKDADFEKVD